jgi:uncharacterized membrane protein
MARWDSPVMLLTRFFDFVLWAAIIEFIGALFIIGYLLAALLLLLQRRDIRRARLLVADGIIYALSFKVAGSLLKTIELHTWQQIWMFAAILGLRIVLKQVFVWERRELGRPI